MAGCYILFFKHNSRRLAIDATKEDSTFGRLINHSISDPNVSMKIIPVDNKPIIVFVALRDITKGEEIQYDYGERREAILQQNPWLR